MFLQCVYSVKPPYNEMMCFKLFKNWWVYSILNWSFKPFIHELICCKPSNHELLCFNNSNDETFCFKPANLELKYYEYLCFCSMREVYSFSQTRFWTLQIEKHEWLTQETGE